MTIQRAEVALSKLRQVINNWEFKESNAARRERVRALIKDVLELVSALDYDAEVVSASLEGAGTIFVYE